jgi:nucleoside-diphosphate-sugar epimerase
MRVTVTGGAGYIGSILVYHLLEQGAEVTVLDRLFYGGEPLTPLVGRPGFRLLTGDVRDDKALREAMTGADAVVHLAAIVGDPACAANEDLSWSINRDGVRAALRMAQECGAGRFLFSSTCSNYGVSSPDTLASEDAALNPLSIYAKSKVEAEAAVLGAEGDIAATVLRFATICGVSPRMRFDLLVAEMARAAALGEPIDIYAPDAWRPFLHVRDAARAISRCISEPVSELVAGRVFNVVGENYQKKGLAELTRRHFPDVKIETTDRMPDLRDYRVSAGLIDKTLGFRPQLTIEDAFLETARAVQQGLFRDPHWRGRSALLDDASGATPAPASEGGARELSLATGKGAA